MNDINRCYMFDMNDIVDYHLEGELTRTEVAQNNGLMGFFKKNKEVQYIENDTRKITLTTRKSAFVFSGKHIELVERIFDDLIGVDKKR